MGRPKTSPSLFRRLTAPLRAFIRTDLDMTQQALRMASPSTLLVMCAPSMFVLWLLDETEAAIAHLQRLIR